MAMDINNKRFNEFRAADAFEFVEIVQQCMKLSDREVEQRRIALAARMADCEKTGTLSTLLLAGYRAYEWVQIMRTDSATAMQLAMTVKLNDTL